MGGVRYAAFLRGVSPTTVKMPALKACVEAAGYADVVTLLSSGNVVFTAKKAAPDAIERRLDAHLLAELGRQLTPFVRPLAAIQALTATDPFAPFRLPANAKRVVTFLPAEAAPPARLPPARDGARILCVHGREAFSMYTPTPKGPVFMQLIEETLGKNVTTRTWDTLKKVAAK